MRLLVAGRARTVFFVVLLQKNGLPQAGELPRASHNTVAGQPVDYLHTAHCYRALTVRDTSF